MPEIGRFRPVLFGVGIADHERRNVVMGWTPPDGIDVPEWRC